MVVSQKGSPDTARFDTAMRLATPRSATSLRVCLFTTSPAAEFDVVIVHVAVAIVPVSTLQETVPSKATLFRRAKQAVQKILLQISQLLQC